ncbi:hypothetical protein [Elioraea thermophila]|uniref:hypothetical protein n=1 Tax=Elioraea thermophila TaxID=2185104 RepID=UPI000DF288B5|nr:hypothetical protein [Elioraea thermophila]
MIYEGAKRIPVAPPAIVNDVDQWFREFIAQTFIPPSLAEFFLFDGEQVQRYAAKAMAKQVEAAIKGLLGLPVLESLKESLGKYADARRKSAALPSDETVHAVEAEIERLLDEIRVKKEIIQHADTLLPALEREQDQLVQQFGGREITVAMVSDLTRDEERFRAAASDATEALIKLLNEEIALALAGPDLRARTLARLRAEELREAWEAGKTQGSANLERYLARLREGLDQLTPPLEEPKREAVLSLVREAWEALWHPAPEGCADSYRFAGLMGAVRQQAIDRLITVGARSAADLEELLLTIRTNQDAAEAKKRERLAIEPHAPEAQRVSERLKEISQEVGRLSAERGAAERELVSLEGKLAAKRQELGRYTDRIGQGKPAIRQAERAERVIALIEAILKEAVPTQVGTIAEAMTKAWKAMAHMSDRVQRIEISPDCQVRMLSETGEDLHEIEKSAGGSQVFTQALIYAVTQVSGYRFPFIVDTPLARLSREQRLGVLKTFTDRPGQVILLSTDEEVVDDKLEAIRDRILAAYDLEVLQDGGVPVTTIKPVSL